MASDEYEELWYKFKRSFQRRFGMEPTQGYYTPEDMEVNLKNRNLVPSNPHLKNREDRK